MKLQYFSDIHLEFLNSTFGISRCIQNKAPILLLPGDIGNPRLPLYEEFLSKVSGNFEKIFLIAGNHEFYHGSVESTEQMIRSICKNYENIVFLQNSFEDYKGYRFVGSTFWSEISNDEYLTNDFRMIDNFTINENNRLHFDAKAFVKKMLLESPFPIIMLSHHLPSNQIVDPFYKKYENYQQCFSSNSDELIRFPIHSWVYGHTHRPYRGSINGVNLYCNPIGFRGENRKKNYNVTFELPDLAT